MNTYLNRELSWLKFNERVLEEAESGQVPLCERLTFASIYQSNLDEFFMVRVGSLADQMLLSKEMRDNKTHMTAEEQIKAVLKDVARLNRRKDAVYAALMNRLEDHGVRLVNFQKLGSREGGELERYFDSEIAPLISPTMVSRRQPFPFLQNKEIYAVGVLSGKSGREKLGIIPCGTGVIPRLIAVPGQPGAYMLSEELILHFLPKVFSGYRVVSKSLMRLTRNADIDADALYDEDLDYREFMAKLIRRRRRLAPVRLELSRELDGDIVKTLCVYADVNPESVLRCRSPLDLSFLFQIQDSLRQHAELFYEKRFPQRSAQFRSGCSILKQIKEKDKLLSYPFESMKPFLDFLQESANDPAVVSIKMTLYRVARHSKIVESLIEAAENGKNVLVLVELKARFDEENNIGWAREMEEAGCRIIYGPENCKCHAKICLITRREKNGLSHITQIGTGNYNEKTSTLYTDFCMMTADSGVAQDAVAFFQNILIGSLSDEYDKLFVAPNAMKNRLMQLIDGEIAKGSAGRIILKANSITERDLIDKLSEASCAGVKIDLIIRGICCLLPGVPGKTDNITVTSIVGRFLEHSRIYCFGEGEERKCYLSSADIMTRNQTRRVEIACPVSSSEIKHMLSEYLDRILSDNLKARRLQNDGNYVSVHNDGEPLNVQSYYMEHPVQMQASAVSGKRSLRNRLRGFMGRGK